jgi:hypothetical protein
MAWLTQNDVNNYGSELIDVTQRAALHALAPELQDIRQQNAELQRRLAQEARRNLDAAVERALPNWRETDSDPRWHRWLLESDPLTGQPRQALLNSAIAASDANRVIAFFRGFQQQVGSTQQTPAASQRARSPASGKIYTREEIARLYRQHQQGAYVGREAEWARLEVDIVRAGAEGRILGALDSRGK